ncbi:MAG TPA: lanthionine synthetase LanC family protein [Longimicrobiaceae bacterium]|jgi:lantibiotic modifying enzyme|nr:lanthionine synthetase LanC family protein [Longimicrobiaceae bacterium]
MTPDPATPGAFLDAAAAIGARLCRDAIWDGRRCNWVGDTPDPSAGAWAIVHRALGPTLYDGTSGIALFLARLHALTGERPFRTAAEGALRHALSRRDALPPETRAALHSGLAGIAYSLAVSGDALAADEWTDHARTVALETAEVPMHPSAVDVISGSAGVIPALLDLHARFGDDALADAAVRHGDFLLSLAKRGEHGTSWRTLEMATHHDLTGYSHGAAGIALSLLELAHATGEACFRAEAEEGFRYERRWFSPQHGNWPDFRIFGAGPDGAPTPPSYGVAWCHGAPGIGLSRLRAYELTGDAIYRHEAEAALRTTASGLAGAEANGGTGFSLCHGDAGNADLLIQAASVLGDAASRTAAERVGWMGINRYLAPDAPWPCGVPNGGETPGLMIGLAGIGYFYLRLHDARNAAPVLVIEPGKRAEPRKMPGRWNAQPGELVGAD